MHEAALVTPWVERQSLSGPDRNKRLPIPVVEGDGGYRESGFVVNCAAEETQQVSVSKGLR